MYKELINVTFQSVVEKKEHIFRALLIPTIFLMILSLFNSGERNSLTLIITIINLLVGVSVSISVYRILILGEESVPRWGSLVFTKRDGIYILNGFLLGLIIAVVCGLPLFLVFTLKDPSLNIFAWFTAFMVFTIIYSRVMIVFPSISIEQKISFKEAWNYTKDYKMLAFMMVFFFPSIFSFIFIIVYGFVLEFLMNVISHHLIIFDVVINIFVAVFTTSFIATAYMYIIKEVDEKQRAGESFYNKPFVENIEDNEPNEIKEIKTEEDIKISIEKKSNISFDSLKQELRFQYENMGFTNLAIDKKDSWMLKGQNEGSMAYIYLIEEESEFIIEAHNTQRPILDVLKEEQRDN